MEAIDRRQIAAVRGAARARYASDYDALLETTGTARIVLLGEASNGTHEFYSERARITRRLIEEKGFTAVAVEADWPDAYRVNRFVRGVSGESALDALAGFRRFPTWMWRNTDVLEFVRWLRAHNDARPDLYSLHQSIHAVLEYLDKVVVHIDETRAVEPLERTSEWEGGEVWETHPTGVVSTGSGPGMPGPYSGGRTIVGATHAWPAATVRERSTSLEFLCQHSKFHEMNGGLSANCSPGSMKAG